MQNHRSSVVKKFRDKMPESLEAVDDRAEVDFLVYESADLQSEDEQQEGPVRDVDLNNDSLNSSMLFQGREEQASLSFDSCDCCSSILVVDDTLFNQIPVKHMIEQINFRCDLADNGLIAVEKYKKMLAKPCGCRLRVPPLIIMDIGMPVMDGKQASKEILALIKQTPHLTNIVALTSFTSQKIIDECLSLGMKEVYFKPLNAETFNIMV